MPSLKAIQRGTVSIASGTQSGTVTITPVDVTKSELRYLGGNGLNSSGSVMYIPRLVLTDSTTITATLGTNSSGTTVVLWELTEWN